MRGEPPPRETREGSAHPAMLVRAHGPEARGLEREARARVTGDDVARRESGGARMQDTPVTPGQPQGGPDAPRRPAGSCAPLRHPESPVVSGPRVTTGGPGFLLMGGNLLHRDGIRSSGENIASGNSETISQGKERPES